ncbi:MAG: LamG domain-containing protein, partial [Candidatus Diapherotrites archaeon]|nr:LamG domain-containing protein [Candidatus Diapherotrites archaeon]
ASLNLTGDLTIEVWVKPGDTQQQYADIIDKNHGSGGRLSYVLQQLSTQNNLFYFAYGDGTNWQGDGISTQLVAGVWQHFVIVKNGVNITHYLNGLQSVTGTTTNPTIANNSGSFSIGRHSSNVRFFNGEIDDVRLYNRALSNDEINAHYERRKFASSEPSVDIGTQTQVNSPTVTNISLNEPLFEIGDSVIAIATATDPNDDPITEFDFRVLDGLGNEVLNPVAQGSDSYSFTVENGELGLWQIKAKASDSIYWGTEFSKEVFVNDSSLATAGLGLTDGTYTNTELLSGSVVLSTGYSTGTYTTNTISPVNFSKWGIVSFSKETLGASILTVDVLDASDDSVL